MLQFSTKPIANGRQVLNSGFGNRCIICGGYFDEAGICNAGHEKDKTYYLPPAPAMVTCEAFSGCHCNICGGFFPDGDNICVAGHQIGQQYPK